MFANFEVLDTDTGTATIHGRHGGNGPPLLPLHGNPMTHATWHKLVPALARPFHAVATDLRGYGEVLSIWRRYARHVEGGPIGCGHYVHEHAPGRPWNG